MHNLLILLYIFFSYHIINCYIYYHPASDKLPNQDVSDGTFPPNTIRVESIADLSGIHIYQGTRHSAGLFFWRDYVNENGGVCLSQDGPDNCDETNIRMNVSIIVYDINKEESEDLDDRLLISAIQKICEKETSQRPHVFVAPYGIRYEKIILGIMSQYDTKYGCFIPTFFHSENTDFFVEQNQFQFSIYPSISLFDGSIEFLSKRNNAKTFALIVADDAQCLFYGESFQKYIESNANLGLSLLMKRCESKAYDLDNIGCESDSDCPNEKCVFARHNGQYLYPTKYISNVRKWAVKLKEIDPDVVVIADSDGTTAFCDISQELQWTPRAVLIIYLYGIRFFSKCHSTYWIYLTPMSSTAELGITSKYMGTTQEYLEYALKKSDKYLYKSGIPNNPSLNIFDEGISSLSSAIGISIQRALEYSYPNYIPNNDCFNTNNYSYLVNAFFHFGECGFYLGTDNSIVSVNRKCNTNDDCGTGIQCFSWETFYGPIHFNKMGENGAASSLLLQIFHSEESDLNTSRHVIGPSSNFLCNALGDCDSLRGWKCGCNSYYPSPFQWLPVSDIIENINLYIAFYIVFFIIILINQFVLIYNQKYIISPYF